MWRAGRRCGCGATCRTRLQTGRWKRPTWWEKSAGARIQNRCWWSERTWIPGIFPREPRTTARGRRACWARRRRLCSGMRPRRTIRFVLFTGEEQGLDGSFAYVRQHRAEMPNHLGNLVLDSGQGLVKEYQLGGRDDLVESFQPFVEALSAIRKISVNDKVDSGTDTLPFSMNGLPGINMDQDSPEYKYTHHSAADALDAVKPEVLAENATLMAMTAFWIADRPERFAAPWPAERTAKMLREQGQYEMLKAFHLWPFGDLGEEKKGKE